MEALLEEAPGNPLEPESTSKSLNDSHLDLQEDNRKNLDKGEADNQTDHGTANQDYDQKVSGQTQPIIFGQVDHKESEYSEHRTSDEAELRASNSYKVAQHTGIDQFNQTMSEQMASKASHQAHHVESEPTDSWMPVLHKALISEQIDHRFSGQADQRTSEQIDRRLSGQTDRRTSEQIDRRLSGQADRRTSEQIDRRLSGQADRRTSEQTDRRLSGQAYRRTSEQTDRRLSGQADRRTSEQTDRRLSGQADRRTSEQIDRRLSGQADQRTSEQTDHRLSDQADQRTAELIDSKKSSLVDQRTSEQIDSRKSGLIDQRTSEQINSRKFGLVDQRTSEQINSRKSGLVEQKTSKRFDNRSSDQIGYKTSVKTHHKVYGQITELTENQVADQGKSSTQHPTVDKPDYNESDHVDEEDDDTDNNQSDYGESNQCDDRIFTNKEDKEADFSVQPGKLETNQTDRSDSMVSAVSNSESATFLEAFNSFDSKFINKFQGKGQRFSQAFPSITAKLDYIISQEKSGILVTDPVERYFRIPRREQFSSSQPNLLEEIPFSSLSRSLSNFTTIHGETPHSANIPGLDGNPTGYHELYNASNLASLGEILKMAKDDSTVRCFQGLLIFGNVIFGMCGIALTAECIFFVSDQHSLYPLLEATDNDDIYGAAWIGMFVGICLFCLSVLGIVGIMKSSRKLLLAYFILMFIVYGFEVASCITAATQRDFFTPNLFLKQMLERYQNNSPPNNDDQWKNNGVTKTWDRLMLQDSCCGVNGPSDWQKYTSAFRTENNDADYPWPRQCCVMNKLKEPLNLDACKLGVPGYYHGQGCYDLISGPMNRHAWGVAWFGFAILCWTFWVLLGTMFYWSRIEY